MIAYKFLRSGRTGPFSAFPWPEPGVWVRAHHGTLACRRGIHACRIRDLPWWLADELWEVELDGSVQVDEHKIVAPAGRLRSHIQEWTPACAREFADACAWRAHARAVEALTRVGHRGAADELTACRTLDAVLAVAPRLADATPETRISVTMAGDGAFRALTAAAPTSAYIAAHAALRLHGADGYAAERAWQASWLAERLGLRNGSAAAPTHGS
jgi:hypothetical protein